MRSLLIIGYGSHGRAVEETARACDWGKIDFADDNNPNAIAKLDHLEEIISQYEAFIVSIGNNEIRQSLYEKLTGANATVLIHPSAYVSQSAVIGNGSIILPGAVVHSNAKIGRGCIISVGALVDHDAIIDDFSHINTGAIVRAGSQAKGKVEAGEVV